MIDPAHARAAEIIAAYGADAARWPDAERVATIAAIAEDPGLMVNLAAARALDADLHAWAAVPVVSGDAVAASRAAMRRPRPSVRWALGMGMAASLAGVLLFVPPERPSATPTMVVSDDATAFSQVFTPTPDEEQML